MNLADAIRQAAYGGAFTPETPGAVAPEAYTPPAEPQAKAPKAKAPKQAPDPEPADAQPTGTTMVRMELFLSPEQLSMLFKAVVATQHSVLTLREAANYLRINPSTLEQMAGHGDLAAFMLDGRWRFPKTGLDEWVATNTFRKEDAADAA